VATIARALLLHQNAKQVYTYIEAPRHPFLTVLHGTKRVAHHHQQGLAINCSQCSCSMHGGTAPFRHSLGSNARMGSASGGTAGTLPPVPGHSTAAALATEQMQMKRRHIVVQQRQLDPSRPVPNKRPASASPEIALNFQTFRIVHLLFCTVYGVRSRSIPSSKFQVPCFSKSNVQPYNTFKQLA